MSGEKKLPTLLMQKLNKFNYSKSAFGNSIRNEGNTSLLILRVHEFVSKGTVLYNLVRPTFYLIVDS